MTTNEEDKCENCGSKITDEDYLTDFESRGEFWGAPCSEEVVYGYSCPACKHEGVF